MRTLVDEFSAARNFWFTSPFIFVAETSAMAISSADEHQLSQRALIDNFPCLLKGGVKTMIEPNLDDHPARRGGLRDRTDLVDMPACGLLDQHVSAGQHGCESYRRELVVSRGDDHRLDLGVNRLTPILHRPSAGLAGETLPPHPTPVANYDDLMGFDCGGTFCANQPASNDRKAHYFLPHDLPRSIGPMRRKV